MTAALASLGFAAACTSVSGLATDEPNDAGTAPTAEDASSADVAYDTPANGTEDAEAAAPTTFCKGLPGTHSFCDDFDDDGAFAASWSGKSQIGGTVGRVDGGVSAPWAYGAIATVTATNLKLEKEFLQTVKSVICELDIRVAQFGVPRTRILRLGFASTQTSQYYVEINLETSSSTFNEYKEYAGGGATSQGGALPVPAVGVWRHLKLNAILKPAPVGGGNPRASVIIDGKEEAVVAIEPPTVDITRAILELGVVNGINGSTSDWKMHFDNVVCDVL